MEIENEVDALTGEEALDALVGMEDEDETTEAAGEGAESTSAGEESSEGSEGDQTEETELSASEMSLDQLVARYQELEDPDERSALLAEIDTTSAREVLSRVSETIVTAPEVAEGETVNWQQRWQDGVLAEMTADLDVFAAEAVADMKANRLPIAPELRAEFDEALAVADSLPPGHSHRKAALERAAGIADYARQEFNASIPFGLGGVQQTKHYQNSKGEWVLREVDGRGMVRETPIENGQAPSELYEEEAPPEPIDISTVSTLEDAARLTIEQWAELDRTDPDRKEALLRLASERQEELHREARAGGML